MREPERGWPYCVDLRLIVWKAAHSGLAKWICVAFVWGGVHIAAKLYAHAVLLMGLGHRHEWLSIAADVIHEVDDARIGAAIGWYIGQTADPGWMLRSDYRDSTSVTRLSVTDEVMMWEGNETRDARDSTRPARELK